MQRRVFLQLLGFLPVAQSVLASVRLEPRLEWLQESPLAGFPYYDAESVWPLLQVGDLVGLHAEPTNPHDEFAVEVYWQDHKLGYLPRAENAMISRRLQAGAITEARIQCLNDSEDIWDRLSISIFAETPVARRIKHV